LVRTIANGQAVQEIDGKQAGEAEERREGMKVRVVVHAAEEGGFWAEVPELPGCFTEADTREELIANLREAVEAILMGPEIVPVPADGQVEELDL
jgi:predicted RNase H-like HicB family nuclease